MNAILVRKKKKKKTEREREREMNKKVRFFGDLLND